MNYGVIGRTLLNLVFSSVLFQAKGLIPVNYGQILPGFPNLHSYLFQTMARVAPAIDELELGSMLPSMPFTDKDVNNVKFYLYTSFEKGESESIESGETEEQLLVNDLSSVHRSTFNRFRDVKVLIHGWNMGLKSRDFPGPVKTAYMDLASNNRGNHSKEFNIVCVDWSNLSREFLYFNSVLYAEKVGRRVGEFIVFLRLGGFIPNYEAVHLIGFSLGAQVAAIAGNFVTKASNGNAKVGRITGLDPAGPGFSSETVPLSQRLDPSDADFVDVIHTNMGHLINGDFGTLLSAGHADFYPNGGWHFNQPITSGIGNQFVSSLYSENTPFLDEVGVHSSGCHHMKSIDYFTLSIEVPYVACKCKDWASYSSGICSCAAKENRAFMGEQCDKRARGKFYLRA